MAHQYDEYSTTDPTVETLLLLDAEIFPSGIDEERTLNKRVVSVGIISYEEYKQRTMAIAQGIYPPKPGEPKIWFESFFRVEFGLYHSFEHAVS